MAKATTDRLVQPTVSAVLPDGALVETVYRPDEHRTVLCVSKDGQWRYEPSLMLGPQRLVPFSANNNLLKNEVVLLPSEPEEFGSVEELVAEIQSFIHRYMDVSPLFERMASYYVLLTWVFDAFDEVPYLRLRGDPGSGKTRFLRTVGALCYKPIFASGASTVSPLFRILDTVRGTLIIDEADFRFSDQTAEIVKILNNGNARGFPVLRSEVTMRREFNPTAYAVFGPKLVATRGPFQDKALESRCITEEMGLSRLREDVPISYPTSSRAEALHLRNKLLLFRFRYRHLVSPSADDLDRSIEPRLNQVFGPLLSIIGDQSLREEVLDLARGYQRDLVAERGQETEAQLLEVIAALAATGERIAVKDITSWFIDRFGEEYERKITTKHVGWLIRKRLHLRTEKRHGVFVIPETERPKLACLFRRYGVDFESEGMDIVSADEQINAAAPTQEN